MKEGVILSESTEAEKKAIRKYLAKCKDVRIKYNPNDMSEYDRLQSYLLDNNISATSYIKQLIKNDLDNKGYWYNRVQHYTIVVYYQIIIHAACAIVW